MAALTVAIFTTATYLLNSARTYYGYVYYGNILSMAALKSSSALGASTTPICAAAALCASCCALPSRE